MMIGKEAGMDGHKVRVAETFDRAAARYGEDGASFFSYFGRRLAEKISVNSDFQILDIATGRGAVLFPLLERIGRGGKIVGIDISKEMLIKAEETLQRSDGANVELRLMDAEALAFSDASFDAVFAGFCLFFLPSPVQALQEWKRVLRTGGKVAVSTWGKRSRLSCLTEEELHKFGDIPSLVATPVWDEHTLRKFLEIAGFDDIRITEEEKTFFHATGADWWDSLWSHATRSKLERLSEKDLATLKANVIKRAEAYGGPEGIPEDLRVLYAVAVKNS